MEQRWDGKEESERRGSYDEDYNLSLFFIQTNQACLCLHCTNVLQPILFI